LHKIIHDGPSPANEGQPLAFDIWRALALSGLSATPLKDFKILGTSKAAFSPLFPLLDLDLSSEI
jgi:hypothetical protein